MHGFKPKANCQLAAIIMHNASKTNDLFKSSIKPNVQGVFDFSVTGWPFFWQNWRSRRFSQTPFLAPLMSFDKVYWFANKWSKRSTYHVVRNEHALETLENELSFFINCQVSQSINEPRKLTQNII